MGVKRVILLGSQGMLGQQIFDDWSEYNDVEVIPLSRFNLNLHHTFDIASTLSDLQPDLILNTAAWTNVDKAQNPQFREEVFQINAEAPGEIAKFCHIKNIPFYHLSTDYVFSGKKDDVFSENSPINPINTYGESKAQGEEKALEYSQTRIIRTAWLAGSSAPNFVHQVVHFAKTKPKLHIVDDQYGSPTFCAPLSQSLYDMVKDPQKYSQGIYHGVCDGNISRFELAQKILEILKIQKPIHRVSSDFFQTEAPRPCSSALKNTLLDSLGSWDNALNSFVSFELEKLEKSREVARKKGIDHI